MSEANPVHPKSSNAVFLDEDFDPDPIATSLPAVVAVVATRGAASLEVCLGALTTQQYPELTVVVIDDGTVHDLAAHVAAVAPNALIMPATESDADGSAAQLPTQGRRSAAGVFNEVIGKVAGAAFLLLVRDDIILDPLATRVMVEESFRSNAAVVGPKFVDRANLSVLIDVGNAIDHYGVAFSPIEPGERDQEQHDGVRDVFFVSERATLIRCDIFEALEGFDPLCVGSEAIDLCWRARIAGARVLVAPDARAQVALECAHTWAGGVPLRARTVGRIRSCCKSASAVSLLWSVPLSFALTVLEAFAFVVRGRGRYAGSVLAAWIDVSLGSPDIHRARAVAQAHRVVDDGEIRVFMIRGSARFRTWLTLRLHVDDVIADASVRTREVIGVATRRFRHAELAVLGLAVLLSIAVVRGLVSGGVTNVGGFARWPSVHDLWRNATSAHRVSNLGADGVASPLLAILASISALLFGHTALVHTLVIVGAAPIGIIGSYRLVRRLSSSAWPAAAASVAYGANPVARNAVASAHLGALVAFAALPWMITMICVTAKSAENARDGGNLRRTIARLAAVSLLAVAVAPTLVLLPFVILAALLGAALLVGEPLAGLRRGAMVGVAGGLVAALVSAPWLASVLGDAQPFGLAQRHTVKLIDGLSFATGANGSGHLASALWIAALLPLFVAPRETMHLAVTGWLLALTGVGIVFVAQHVSATTKLPELEMLFVMAAAGLAMSIGVGVAAVVSELRTFMFGARQAAVVVALVAVVIPVFSWFGDLGDAHARGANSDWGTALNWVNDERARIGDFRVVWIGQPDAMPSPSIDRRGVQYSITRGASTSVLDHFAPTTTAANLVGDALALSRSGATSRLGHLLAPMSVRYVAVIDRVAPDGRRLRDSSIDVAALGNQLDFTVVDDSTPGLRLYRNLSWIPALALAPTKAAIPMTPAATSDPTAAALMADLEGTPDATRTKGPGTLLLAETASPHWTATQGRSTLTRRKGFGWSNVWRAPGRDSVQVTYDEPWWPTLLTIAELVALLIVLAAAVAPNRRRSAGIHRATPTEAADLDIAEAIVVEPGT